MLKDSSDYEFTDSRLLIIASSLQSFSSRISRVRVFNRTMAPSSRPPRMKMKLR